MIRVFPRRTKWTPNDELSFIGDPPLFRPPVQPVYISCAFTWDIQEAERLKRSWQRFYPEIYVGGPAYDDPGKGFVPGRFIMPGVTITSRGCTKECEWCLVPEREGWIRELPINDGWINNDNNLLACSKKHIESVFKMLRRQTRAIQFNGGFDAELFNEYHVKLIDTIKVEHMWFSCDYPGALGHIEKVRDLLRDYPRWKKRCYVLYGHNDIGLNKIENLMVSIYNMGFLPAAQLYRPKEKIKKLDYDNNFIKFEKIWSRPAIYKSIIRKAA